MPKKNMTPAAKKAWGEKMKAAREAKANQNTPASETLKTSEPARPSVEVSASIPEINTDEITVAELLARIKELEAQRFFTPPPVDPGATVSSRGITGTITKYSTNPKDYPDPRERLFGEAKLKLKGFSRDWWDLEWIVSRVNYDTKDGIHMAEPKFQIRLIRIIEDPETGLPSNKRYTLWKGTFFEDPEAAIQVAAQYGIEVGEEMEKVFLDEMRYLRMRDWLLEAFFPPKPSQDKVNKTETVIGNRLVEVYEINSQESATIPFQNISKKL
jgi:hypothetical protein